MNLEEELRWYLSNRQRRRELVRLELMAARPTLSQRRAVRPRVGIIKRLLKLVKEVLSRA